LKTIDQRPNLLGVKEKRGEEKIGGTRTWGDECRGWGPAVNRDGVGTGKKTTRGYRCHGIILSVALKRG